MTNEPLNRQPDPAVTSAQPQCGAAAPAQDKAGMLNAEIRKTWSKLSDDDIRFQSTDPDRFFAKLREVHGVSREDAKKRLKEITAACDTSCTAGKAA